MSHSGMCTAFFLGPSEPATGNGDTAEYWSFVLPHYNVLLKITDAWSVKFKGNGTEKFPEVNVDGDENASVVSDGLVTSIAEKGGTYRTIAAVWYVMVVSAGAFKSKDMAFKSEAAHRHLYWWMALEILLLSRIKKHAVDNTPFLKLPVPSTNEHGDGWFDAERAICIDEMEKAAGSEKHGDLVELYISTFYGCEDSGVGEHALASAMDLARR